MLVVVVPWGKCDRKSDGDWSEANRRDNGARGAWCLGFRRRKREEWWCCGVPSKFSWMESEAMKPLLLRTATLLEAEVGKVILISS